MKSWTEQQLVVAVKTNITWSGVVKDLGLKRCSGNFRTVKKYVEQLKLSTGHFDPRPPQRQGAQTYTLNQILVQNSTYTNPQSLKRRLIREGLLTYRCDVCGISEWEGKPLCLQLDHKNGQHDDHRIGNLRLLCPNCHSQTPTYAGKNRKIFPKKTPRICLDCSKPISKRATRCVKCLGEQRKQHTRIEWPPIEDLQDEIRRTSFAAIGRKLGVSDNAVRQHLRRRDAL